MFVGPRHTLPRAASAIASCLLVACLGAPPPDASHTNFAIGVAPLTLPGVGDACYDLVVTNGAGETVWSRTDICADTFGNGRGDISYIGPCDATKPAHTVALTLRSLEDVDGNPITDFQNPTATGPIELPATCVENADTLVVFNLTILRGAGQGFFDIAVNFDDVFCSAKLDCDAGTLLFDPVSGLRIPSAVMALACTGGPGAHTHLYYSDLQLVCDGAPLAISLLRPPGNFYSATDPAPAPFSQVASYQGVEQLTNPDGTPLAKAFFNVAFGLPATATGNCSLAVSATVSDGPLAACNTPAATVYPVIQFSAPTFVANGAFGCAANPLDGAGGVTTTYVGPATSEHFAVQAEPVGNALELTSCGCDGLGVGLPMCCRSYPIRQARLDNLPWTCGTGGYYSDDQIEPWGTESYGFHWDDAGSGAVTSATVALNPGVSCGEPGERVTLVNGAATTPPTFTLPGDDYRCTCEPSQIGPLPVSVPLSSYVVGGANALVVVEAPAYEGFQTFPATSIFARVDVCYTTPPPPPDPAEACAGVVCDPAWITCRVNVCDPADGICKPQLDVGGICNNYGGDPCLIDVCDTVGDCVEGYAPGVAEGTRCNNGSGSDCLTDLCDPSSGLCLDSTEPAWNGTACDDSTLSCSSGSGSCDNGICNGTSTGFTCGESCCAFGELCSDGACAAPPNTCLSYDTTVRDGGACPVDGCPATCLAILDANPSAQSGIYMLDPGGSGAPFPVRCDMDYDGGGWTLVAFERAGEPNPPYTAGALQYLHFDSSNPAAIAGGTDDGIIGVRFPYGSTYTTARFNWCDPNGGDNFFARFATPEELFADTRRDNLPGGYPHGGQPTIVLSSFATNDAFLNGLVPSTNDARFCRAATLSPSWRPGDTSWAIKDNNDSNFWCGCNSGGWTGVGTYYGGEPNGTQTRCVGWGGGFAGSKANSEAKGGQNNNTIHIWIR